MSTGAIRAAAQPSGLLRLYTSMPVLFCFCAMAILTTALWCLGFQLNNDADDLLKLHEIRTLLETGNIFDRTLPGIVQPEPYVSHWPWIVDLPYAAFARLFAPFAGFEPALTLASFAVPLLLLAPALYFYNRLVTAIGFAYPAVALPLALIFAARSFFEFAPGRIDYHNLQILLLLAALVLMMSQNRFSAFVNGLLTALAIAVSAEFAPFYALVMAVYAFDWIFDREGGESRIVGFGLALTVGAIALFAAIVPPSAYTAVRCDTYSTPHVTALVAAGLSFAVVPLLAGRRGGWPMRSAILLVFAAASAAVLAVLFPQCLASPYASIDAYVRDNMINRILQELSLFRRPDVVLSTGFLSMALLFIGALAPAVICARPEGRSRPLVILALFALVSLALAIGYVRYYRYLPIFSGIGLIFALASLLPNAGLGRYLKSPVPAASHGYALILPGLVLSGAMVLYHLSVKPAHAAVPAAELADGCYSSPFEPEQGWPSGAIVLSPPLIGSRFVALAEGPKVVTIPNHPSAKGIERSYRFLDPATADPRAILDASKATHVAICAWRGPPLPGLEAAYPFAAGLIEGRPPAWLRECPTKASSPLRIYSYRNADGSDAACPTSTLAAQARP
ncbi:MULTISPECIES: hypothetical protein [unclassified Mesorhizobium]|uniref:hypothetical protein n=1 Tax=unclassified Mesorhizobium TaxID=325217 RepID=UPI000BB05B8A|nr:MULTISPECIES: hypothetical protein [unclassified Mesorhizobium]PBC22693.1 hypothetical protein CK226_12780 [Mesorhizobium sp. WSM4311]TRD08137.1 hypothetical protein FJV82_05565 [Mesorhizobium sp. WSM4305]